MQSNENQKFMSDIDALEVALDAKAASPCDTYRRIKPTLELILPFVEKIPGWGATIAKAVRALMAIADQFCPAS